MGGDEPGGFGASLADDDGPSPVLLGGQGLAIPGRTLLDRPGFCGGCVVTLRWVSRRGVDRSSASQRWLENSRSCCCGEGCRVVSVDPLGDGGLEVVAVLPGSGPDQLALVGLAQGLGRGVVVGRAHPASGGVGPLRQEPVGVGDGQVLRHVVASGVRGL